MDAMDWAARLGDGKRVVADGTADPFPRIIQKIPLRELGHASVLRSERPDGLLKAVVAP